VLAIFKLFYLNGTIIIFAFSCYRTYGGFSKDQVTKREHDALWNSLSEDDKRSVDKSAPFYFAGYDAPFKLFHRRNEIWMPIKESAASCSVSSPLEENN
jgi:hypothetical protein